MNCPICAALAEEIAPVIDGVSIHCPNCGDYDVSGTVVSAELLERSEPERQRQALATAMARAEPCTRPKILSYDF